MHFTPVLGLLFVAIIGYVQADLTQYIGNLPACGLKCLLDVIPKSVCGLTNQTCICSNQALSTAANLCVSQNCTVIESLQVANISSLSCGVARESQQLHLQSTVGLEAVALVSGAVRLYSRWSLESRFQADDYIMILVLILSVPFATFGVLAAVFGFGLNIWEISPSNLTLALKYFFIGEMFYIPILGFCKVSILLFYLRIFPSRNFKITSYTILGVVIISTVIVEFLTLFQCTPVSYNWEGWKESGSGKCTDPNSQTYASSSVNIALDFIILLLPIPWLLKLQVSLRYKLNVILMFSIGIFICITSVVRLTKLVQFRKTQNPTWDYVDTTYWTAIETYISIIVPSLPAIRAFLSRALPTIFGSDTWSGSRSNYEQSRPRTGEHFKMSSKLKKSSTTGTGTATDSERNLRSNDQAAPNSAFNNPKMNLGDQMKGTVYTDVSLGNGGSDVELARPEGIFVSTQTQVEARNRSSGSMKAWDDAADYVEVRVREHP